MTENLVKLYAKYSFDGKQDPQVIRRFAQDVLGMHKLITKSIKPGREIGQIITEGAGTPQTTVKFVKVEWTRGKL